MAISVKLQKGKFKTNVHYCGKRLVFKMGEALYYQIPVYNACYYHSICYSLLGLKTCILW